MKRKGSNMMKFNIISTLILVAALSGCKIKDPFFKKIDNVVVLSINSNQVNLSADLTLHNPNNISCTLKEVNFDVFTDKNVKLTSIKQTYNSEMAAKSDFVVPIMITLDPKKLVSTTEGIFGSFLSAIGNREFEIIYKGSSKVEKLGVTIPIHIESRVSFKLGSAL